VPEADTEGVLPGNPKLADDWETFKAFIFPVEVLKLKA
jgi:hypothetical protein